MPPFTQMAGKLTIALLEKVTSTIEYTIIKMNLLEAKTMLMALKASGVM